MEKGIFILSWPNEKLQFPVDLPPLWTVERENNSSKKDIPQGYILFPF